MPRTRKRHTKPDRVVTIKTSNSSLNSRQTRGGGLLSKMGTIGAGITAAAGTWSEEAGKRNKFSKFGKLGSLVADTGLGSGLAAAATASVGAVVGAAGVVGASAVTAGALPAAAGVGAGLGFVSRAGYRYYKRMKKRIKEDPTRPTFVLCQVLSALQTPDEEMRIKELLGHPVDRMMLKLIFFELEMDKKKIKAFCSFLHSMCKYEIMLRLCIRILFMGFVSLDKFKIHSCIDYLAKIASGNVHSFKKIIDTCNIQFHSCFDNVEDCLDTYTIGSQSDIFKINFENLGDTVSVSDLLKDLVNKDNKKIQHIDLSSYLQKTDIFIQDLSGVEHINVEGCIKLERIHLDSQTCAGLQHINLSKCIELTLKNIEHIATTCRRLQHINVEGCSKFNTDYSKKVKLNNDSIVTDDKKIKVGTLLTDVLNNGDAVLYIPTDKATLPAGAKNPDHVYYVRKVDSNKGIIVLFNTANEALRNNSGLEFKTDDDDTGEHTFKPYWMENSIKSLATNCRELQHINFKGFEALKDADLELLATHCTGLQHINLSGCRKLTNPAITKLATHCKKLQHIDLSDCLSLKCEAKIISTIATNCTELQYIDMSRCPNWEEDATTPLTDNLKLEIKLSDPGPDVKVVTTRDLNTEHPKHKWAYDHAGSGGGLGTLTYGDSCTATNTVNGVELVMDERIFVHDQETTQENGVYSLTQVGDATDPTVLTRVNGPLSEHGRGTKFEKERGMHKLHTTLDWIDPFTKITNCVSLIVKLVRALKHLLHTNTFSEVNQKKIKKTIEKFIEEHQSYYNKHIKHSSTDSSTTTTTASTSHYSPLSSTGILEHKLIRVDKQFYDSLPKSEATELEYTRTENASPKTFFCKEDVTTVWAVRCDDRINGKCYIGLFKSKNDADAAVGNRLKEDLCTNKHVLPLCSSISSLPKQNLDATITDTDVNISLKQNVAMAGMPTSGFIYFDKDEELVEYTSLNGNSLEGCTRRGGSSHTKKDEVCLVYTHDYPYELEINKEHTLKIKGQLEPTRNGGRVTYTSDRDTPLAGLSENTDYYIRYGIAKSITLHRTKHEAIVNKHPIGVQYPKGDDTSKIISPVKCMREYNMGPDDAISSSYNHKAVEVSIDFYNKVATGDRVRYSVPENNEQRPLPKALVHDSYYYVYKHNDNNWVSLCRQKSDAEKGETQALDMKTLETDIPQDSEYKSQLLDLSTKGTDTDQKMLPAANNLIHNHRDMYSHDDVDIVGVHVATIQTLNDEHNNGKWTYAPARSRSGATRHTHLQFRR